MKHGKKDLTIYRSAIHE